MINVVSNSTNIDYSNIGADTDAHRLRLQHYWPLQHYRPLQHSLPSFTWCDEYMTICTLFNGNSLSVVKQKNGGILAIVDKELLPIQLPGQSTKNCVFSIRDDQLILVHCLFLFPGYQGEQ